MGIRTTAVVMRAGLACILLGACADELSALETTGETDGSSADGKKKKTKKNKNGDDEQGVELDGGTGAGGTTGGLDTLDTGAATTGEAGDSLGGTVGGTAPPTQTPAGYVQFGSWQGYAWTAANNATIDPVDFSTTPAGSPLCASGVVSPAADYSGIAMVGFNLNQGSEAMSPANAVTPTDDGVFVSVSNPGGSALRVQLQGPTDSPTDRWCAELIGDGGFIPWQRFNTACWDGSGDRYAGQPLASAGILAPGGNENPVPYDVCLHELRPSSSTDTAPPPPSGSGLVTDLGQLDCVGNQIRSANTGGPAQVRGVSFFWSNWSSELWRADMVDRMVDEFSAELVRAAYGVTDEGTPHNYGNEDAVRRVVDRAIERGVYVIIDWHTHGANHNVGAAQDFFGRMAEEYGQYDNVIFEVFNEPIDQSWGEVKDYAEQVIPVIRAHSDNLIIVGTPNYSQEVDDAAVDPLADPNVAYALHFYAVTHREWLRARGDAALNAGVCLFVTEWGMTHADGGQWVNGNAGLDRESTEAWLGWMDHHQLSWANWSIMNKEESSSIFQPGTETLSEAGDYLAEILARP